MRCSPFILLGLSLMWVSSCSKGGGDVVDGEDENSPPSRITDLSVAQVTSASVTLRWTAPAGGGTSATAAFYDLRCAASMIDESNWAAALGIEDEPAPGLAGLPQSMVLTGVPPDTVVYFAMRACSHAGVVSEISNSPAAVVPPETAVVFADPALESVIRTILQKPAGDLMPVDLLAVTEIEADHLGIHSLEGIQYCVSLHRLNLQGNAVTDLGPLGGLVQLSDLDASDNQIADLGPLSDLTAMMNLNLSGNAIQSIGALEDLEILNFLWLDRNQLTNIAPVAGCWRLNHLFMSDNHISDLGPLVSMKYLADLDLAGNAIEDLSPLVTNTEFGTGDRIWLARNPLSQNAIDEQIPALRARGVIVYER
ncbi:MAG TPA: hypothetical protein PLL30_16015 [Candidatus Krumholzibacteria bacterium]|nr:hypothetical protein [Candidatus Krumholzibacteria bacterium]HPD73276.1 hypothetical protein [Candidatus Krumholzibacteria bacterium]HRY40238.1 hypothetical protein [Candidatus Krumholzibacteria bacterium]